MRAVCRHTLFGGNSHHNENTLGKFIRSVLFDHVETECGNRKVFKRLSFYFHLGALITKVSFLSLYVY